MAIPNNAMRSLQKFRNISTIRSFTAGKIIYNKSTGGSTKALPDVPGLSEACVKVPQEPVGPGAAKNTGYKNPEYFCYDKNSYFEAEMEMMKYRCPQPSTAKPYFPSSK